MSRAAARAPEGDPTRPTEPGPVLSICVDDDCPACGWPETFAICTEANGPEYLGCRKCGWSKPLR